MEGQEGGEAQQKEESSKRHTYPLIRVSKKKFKLFFTLFSFLINLNLRIVTCTMK